RYPVRCVPAIRDQKILCNMNIIQGFKGVLMRTKSLGMPAPQWSFINGMWVPMVDNPEKYIREGYKANAYVFSIVSHIVDKASDAPGQIFRVTDDIKSKQWKMLTKDNHDFMSVMKARVLKSQAFEEVDGHEFIKLL